jgi:hypothetical protein
MIPSPTRWAKYACMYPQLKWSVQFLDFYQVHENRRRRAGCSLVRQSRHHEAPFAVSAILPDVHCCRRNKQSMYFPLTPNPPSSTKPQAGSTLTALVHAVSVIGPTGAPFFRNPSPATGSPENHIAIREYSFLASGANAKTTRPPITVVRQVDGASPLLLTALINSSVLREVSILSLFDMTVNGQAMTGMAPP